MNKSVLHFGNILLALCALSLAACGYHLRGQSDLSFHTLYMQKSSSPAIASNLRRLLKFNGIKVVDVPEQAEMQLELMNEASTQDILSLSGGGTVSEYAVRYSVTFRTRPSTSELWGPPQTISQQRSYSYDNSLLLAKTGEAERLVEDMHAEAAREIMRRLSAQNPGKPSAEN
jgi:LPS-assembly lipoprotein